jgi:hypothetical protein
MMRIVTASQRSKPKTDRILNFWVYFPTDTEGMSSLYLPIHAMSFLFFWDIFAGHSPCNKPSRQSGWTNKKKITFWKDNKSRRIFFFGLYRRHKIWLYIKPHTRRHGVEIYLFVLGIIIYVCVSRPGRSHWEMGWQWREKTGWGTHGSIK